MRRLEQRFHCCHSAKAVVPSLSAIWDFRMGSAQKGERLLLAQWAPWLISLWGVPYHRAFFLAQLCLRFRDLLFLVFQTQGPAVLGVFHIRDLCRGPLTRDKSRFF